MHEKLAVEEELEGLQELPAVQMLARPTGSQLAPAGLIAGCSDTVISKLPVT
jgi:hypothetical protein